MEESRWDRPRRREYRTTISLLRSTYWYSGTSHSVYGRDPTSAHLRFPFLPGKGGYGVSSLKSLVRCPRSIYRVNWRTILETLVYQSIYIRTSTYMYTCIFVPRTYSYTPYICVQSTPYIYAYAAAFVQFRITSNSTATIHQPASNLSLTP